MRWILSFLLLILFLGAGMQPLSDAEWLNGQLGGGYQTEDSAITEQAAEEVTAETAAVGTEAEPEISAQPQTAFSVNVDIQDIYQDEAAHIIVMGDSRTVCLYCAMTYTAEEFPAHVFYHIAPDYTGFYEDSTFVAKGGEGYAWFQAYGAALGVSHIDENSVLVVWFGVNDLGNVSRYVDYMNSTLLPYGVPVYYMTVGPCDQHWSDTNPEVESFNAALKEGLNPQIKVIDMHAFISEGMASGQFGTMDGLHYNYETCRAIYQHMVEVIAADLQQ